MARSGSSLKRCPGPLRARHRRIPGFRDTSMWFSWDRYPPGRERAPLQLGPGQPPGSPSAASAMVTGREGTRRQRQFQTVESTAWKAGSDSVRFGADYRGMAPIRRGAASVLSAIADDIASLTVEGPRSAPCPITVAKSPLHQQTPHGQLDLATKAGR